MHELWSQRNTELQQGQRIVLRIYSKVLRYYTMYYHVCSVLSLFLSHCNLHRTSEFSGNLQLDSNRLYAPTMCKPSYTIYLSQLGSYVTLHVHHSI